MIQLNYTSLLNMIATLFLMLIVGYIAGKMGIITETASKNLSALIIKIGQPAMIIYNLVKMSYSAENLGLGFLTLAFSLGVHIFLAAVSYFAFLRFRDIDARKLSEFSAIFGNVGFIGIPILESVFGDKGGFMGSFSMWAFSWCCGRGVSSSLPVRGRISRSRPKRSSSTSAPFPVPSASFSSF